MSSQTELLTETIGVIIEQLLLDSKFCGSPAGRRLRTLHWAMVGTPLTEQPIEQPADPRDRQPLERREFVSSTLVLPLALDTALASVSEKSGVSRYDLITNSISAMIASVHRA